MSYQGTQKQLVTMCRGRLQPKNVFFLYMLEMCTVHVLMQI